MSYKEIVETIMYRKEDVVTIEVDPAYGKYHWTGHRNCNVSLPPDEAIRLKGICPVCGKKMTKGVAERVEELADRMEGVIPEGAQKFISLLPLSEVIATVLRKDIFSGEVQKKYWDIVGKFTNELEVLMKASKERLEEACSREIVDMILMNREGRLVILPGYDGVYGKPDGIKGN
jgi:PHP family Zn ribbon phosphoesterase